MRKLINQPEQFVEETLEGIALAHADQVALLETDKRVVVRAARPQGPKVGIVTGGGFGHLPVFLGYVGEGLADSCAVGNVFSSPGCEQILHAMEAADSGMGVLQLFGCYQGDKMNFKMAGTMAKQKGMKVETVIVSDDVASAPPEQREKRRGIAGLVLVYKIAGACAEAGCPLSEVARVARKAADAVRTFGVSLSACTIPTVGHPNFSIPEGMMEVGMGIHGEPGIDTCPILSADDTAALLMERILSDLEFPRGSTAALLVNGLGGTPLEELYLLYRKAAQICGERGIALHRRWIGEYATSLEMAGASLSLIRLDEELTRYLDAPCRSPFFRV